MTYRDHDVPATDCGLESTLACLLPFLLLGPPATPDIARGAIRALIRAYDASNPSGRDVAGRVMGSASSRWTMSGYR
jgi:hypothetical protein